MSLRKGFVVGVIVVVFASLLGPSPVVWAEDTDEPTGTEITLDLAIARPVGFASLVCGTTIFVVSFPFALVAGSSKKTADALVSAPYNFTFVRDLGEY
ncbi:MAG: hypothetical protein JXA50_04405 [Deltaproteobacteria bacterium]|nr:hypothetical protein [Deltaproteobacteria bacterium]